MLTLIIPPTAFYNFCMLSPIPFLGRGFAHESASRNLVPSPLKSYPGRVDTERTNKDNPRSRVCVVERMQLTPTLFFSIVCYVLLASFCWNFHPAWRYQVWAFCGPGTRNTKPAKTAEISRKELGQCGFAMSTWLMIVSSSCRSGGLQTKLLARQTFKSCKGSSGHKLFVRCKLCSAARGELRHQRGLPSSSPRGGSKPCRQQ